jgi:O-methyltransferase
MIQGIKQLSKILLRQLGYEIRRVKHPDEGRSNRSNSNKDFIAAQTVEESQYYAKWSAPCPLFSPWVGHPDFQALYEGVAPHTIVSPDRCYILASFAQYASHLQGDFAECGVYNGGTAFLLSRVLKDTNKMLYLFDSFKGLPKVNPEEKQWFSEGQYASTSTEAVEELLSDYRSMIDIRCGWIPQTFSGLEAKFYAFAHLDVDLHQSNLDCCKYFYPRLVPGGVMIFDEYAFAAARGEKDAVDQFFGDKAESPITLPTGQAIVLKVHSKSPEL